MRWSVSSWDQGDPSFVFFSCLTDSFEFTIYIYIYTYIYIYIAFSPPDVFFLFFWMGGLKISFLLGWISKSRNSEG